MSRNRMEDPLNAIASLLTIATAGVRTARSLREAAKRYNNRNSTLRRLQDEIQDVENILVALQELLDAANSKHALAADISMPELLQEPIKRCSQVCSQFEEAMSQFSRNGKSKAGIVDWAKMEFMRGDINQFMDTVAGYKSTISVGLGVLTMRTAKMSHQALAEYEEMLQNTMSNLNLQLQRINENMGHDTRGSSSSRASRVELDLTDERQVTEHCLQICEDAKAYLENLASRGSDLLQTETQGASAGLQSIFDAQLLTRQALTNNQASFVDIITQLRQRLESVVTNGDSTERLRLEQDLQASKTCLEVCKLASSEVTNQKIHIIGEVVADENSDQVVVTTLADMFNVGKATSKNNSALLVGSMSDAALMKISDDRYKSRFGTANLKDHVTTPSVAIPRSFDSASIDGESLRRSQRSHQPTSQKCHPSSNEAKRRAADPSASSEKMRGK